MFRRTWIRHLVVSIGLLIAAGACSAPVPAPVQGFEHYILTADQKPISVLSELLSLCSIKHDNSLDSIVQETQKAWLRPAGIERFQMADVYADRKAEFMPLFQKLALIDEIKPTKKQYCYCLVHGASMHAARVRIAYVIKLWNDGVRFDQLVFLTGQRTLDSEKESVKELLDRTQKVLPVRIDWKQPEAMPETESTMMRMLYDQAQMPQALRMVPFNVIDIPYQETAIGQKRRPNTQDTVRGWVKTNPFPGACLAISNQPFIACQDTIMRADLPKTNTLETVGASIALEDQVSVSMTLDALARWLYQVNTYKK